MKMKQIRSFSNRKIYNVLHEGIRLIAPMSGAAWEGQKLVIYIMENEIVAIPELTVKQQFEIVEQHD